MSINAVAILCIRSRGSPCNVERCKCEFTCPGKRLCCLDETEIKSDLGFCLPEKVKLGAEVGGAEREE